MDERIQRIADHYGLDLQLDMLQEECAELVQAVSKYRRGKCSEIGLAEEMADVYIMLEQIRYLLNNQPEVKDWINFKVTRQLLRIKGETHE